MPKESDLYAPLIAGANREGWRLFRIEDGSWGRKVADIAGITSTGRGVLVEVKIGNGPLRANQEAWLKEYEAKGGLGLIARYQNGNMCLFRYGHPIVSGYVMRMNRFGEYIDWSGMEEYYEDNGHNSG